MDCTVEHEVHGSVFKVLGLVCRPATNDFVFDPKSLLMILKQSKNRKRSVLQSAARLCDPLGFLTPFTVRINGLFQEMWERGLSWDEVLPPDHTTVVLRICSATQAVHLMVVYHTGHMCFVTHVKGFTFQLHICKEKQDGEMTTSLVASMFRVAPLKGL